MKSLREYLPESFLVELGEGPSDSNSPVNGSTSDSRPNPAATQHGNRELKIGDPVKITGDGQWQGAKGTVDDVISDGHVIVVEIKDQGKKSFRAIDVAFDDYGGKDEEEDDYLRALNNYKTLAGY